MHTRALYTKVSASRRTGRRAMSAEVFSATPPHNGYVAIRPSGRPVLKDAMQRLHQGNSKVANYVSCFMNQNLKNKIVMLTAKYAIHSS